MAFATPWADAGGPVGPGGRADAAGLGGPFSGPFSSASPASAGTADGPTGRPVRAADTAAPQPLAQWLRLLWNAAPALHLDSAAPFIAAGGIHLPPQPRWQQHCAAAAHAAAHLVYSPVRFEAAGLVPTARALLALLEDARVEALAMRELPGLARLWRPLHGATPTDGHGCEALMARLARALADPDYRDPHPWVAKGRRLFYLDEGLGLPALRTPDELRSAAMRLGHDIGQMRLPFNARGYRPAPAYRDDHRWMWAADQLATEQPAPQPIPEESATQAEEPPEALPDRVSHQPEWDRLIRRLRPDWARVVETTASTPAAPAPAAELAAAQQASQRLRAPLQALARPQAPRGRSAEGDAFHLDALLAWATARRCGQAGDARVYRARQPQAARAAAWVLVDASASTAALLAGPCAKPAGALASAPPGASAAVSPNTSTAAFPGSASGAPPATASTGWHSAVGTAPSPPGPSVLQAAAGLALTTALALQALGVPCAVLAFSSHGRLAVRLRTLQPLGPTPDGGRPLAAQLAALRPGGSTRLGAALRHAGGRLAGGQRGARWVLLISDGEPHDTDVHDPRYLVEDARHAVQAARRRGVRMACLTLSDRASPEARRIFGASGQQGLNQPGQLPQALRRLLARGG